MSQFVQVSRERGVMTLGLDRPEKLNALTREMYATLAQALGEAGDDNSVRAVLIRGSENCFSSGNDIQDFLKDPPSDTDSPVFRFMHAVLALEKPLLAAVSGVAVGIGTTLLLHCDLVYVSRDARLQVPFVNLGLTPEFGASLILPQRLGHVRASELLLLGQAIDGERAVAWGLANEALDNGADAFARALEVAESFQRKAPGAILHSKRLMLGNQRELLLKVIDEEARIFGQRLRSPEALEAFNAFIQRRQPDFSKQT
jgi:enoyl-CoA hydratase/carnithine racemase